MSERSAICWLAVFFIALFCLGGFLFGVLFGMARLLIFCGVTPRELRTWALKQADLAHKLLDRLLQQLVAIVAKILRHLPPAA